MPRSRAEGYAEMFTQLERDLAEITGFAATSLQPIGERVGEIAVRPVEVSRIQVGGVLQSGPEPKQPPRPADAGFRP